MDNTQSANEVPDDYLALVLPRHWDRFTDQIVDALKSKGDLSDSLIESAKRKFFGGRLSLSGGWQDPLRAPKPLLMKHLSSIYKGPDDCDKLMLDLWSHSQKSLRRRISQHFDAIDVDISEMEPPAFVETQVETIALDYPSLDKDDVMLMAKIIYSEHKERSYLTRDYRELDGPAALLIRHAHAFQGALLQHPASQDEWDNLIPAIVEDLNTLVAEKTNNRKSIAALVEHFESFRRECTEKLSFFGELESEWDIEALEAYGNINTFEDLITGLREKLEEYEELKILASNLEEEKTRREKRSELEENILFILTKVNETLQESVELASDVDPSVHESSNNSEASDLDAEELTDDEIDDEDYAGQMKTRIEALEYDMAIQSEEIDSLRGQLNRSKGQEQIWRHLYEEERKSKDESAPDPLPKIETMAQAVDVAEERYGDKITIRLNSKSDIKSNYYGNPHEVWEALEWLATTYCESRANATVSEISHSIRNVCGWWYKPDQNDITVSQFQGWYETHIDGVKFDLRKHIGKGAVRNSSNTIRIAFEWDDANERVVVGYIGRHQRNRRT